MSATQPTLSPPSPLLWLAEARAPWEALASLGAWPLLQLSPRGDGHPVLVLPGLLASDASTALLRHYLRQRGYAVHGWGQGRNLGPRAHVEPQLAERLQRLADQSGRKPSLVGWSLGGAYARLLAQAYPELVRCVVTLGSPVAGGPRATRAWRVYEILSGERADDQGRWHRLAATPRVPTTSIYSRSDAVVAWRASVQAQAPQCENIEVVASHLGLPVHPAVLHALADRLAQPEGAWQPFPGWARSARVAGVSASGKG